MSVVLLAIVIFISMSFGFVGAEIWHRIIQSGYKRERLIAEFMDRQLWQFISLDEWLKKEE